MNINRTLARAAKQRRLRAALAAIKEQPRDEKGRFAPDDGGMIRGTPDNPRVEHHDVEQTVEQVVTADSAAHELESSGMSVERKTETTDPFVSDRTLDEFEPDRFEEVDTTVTHSNEIVLGKGSSGEDIVQIEVGPDTTKVWDVAPWGLQGERLVDTGNEEQLAQVIQEKADQHREWGNL